MSTRMGVEVQPLRHWANGTVTLRSPLPRQAVIPSHLLQGGESPVAGRAASALGGCLASAKGCRLLSLRLSRSAPHAAAYLQPDKTSLPSAKPDPPLRGFVATLCQPEAFLTSSLYD